MAHEKENFAMLGVRGIGEQDENAFLLLDPGQVEQIGIRMDDEGAIRIGRKNVVCVDDRERLRFQQLGEATPVVFEQFGF